MTVVLLLGVSAPRIVPGLHPASGKGLTPLLQAEHSALLCPTLPPLEPVRRIGAPKEAWGGDVGSQQPRRPSSSGGPGTAGRTESNQRPVGGSMDRCVQVCPPNDLSVQGRPRAAIPPACRLAVGCSICLPCVKTGRRISVQR